MYELKCSMTTETAHLLKDHPGKCKNIHGHSYLWTVCVISTDVFEEMICDFSFLKGLMFDVIDPFDHALVVDSTHEELARELSKKVYITHGRPTAENMAKMVHQMLAPMLPVGVQLKKVCCRETQNNEACYYESI